MGNHDMAVNVKELRRVQRHIRRYPEKHDQSRWICGTTACVAGRVALLNGFTPVPWLVGVEDVRSPTTGRVRRIPIVAQELLGLTRRDANRLFDGDNTPERVHAVIDGFCEAAQ